MVSKIKYDEKMRPNYPSGSKEYNKEKARLQEKEKSEHEEKMNDIRYQNTL